MKTNGSRRELELRANQTRTRLLGTIDALDRRRHELTDLRLQLRRHAPGVLAAFGGLLIGVGATAAIVLYRQSLHERRLRRERMRAIARLWQHPDRIAVRPSPLRGALRLVLVALATMATTTFGTYRLERSRRTPRLPAPPTEPLGV
jgi:hypothetical protein